MGRLPARVQHRARGTQRHARSCPRARRPTRRVLREHRERQGFRQRQLARILAEVDEACRRGALEVAAIRDEVEIRLQDLSLGVAELELHGATDLSQFAAGRGGADAVKDAGKLHRDGRATLAPRPHDIGLPRAAHQRQGIDARMKPEVPVLLQHGRVHQQRRNAIERHPDAVLLVRRERQPQQTAAPVVYRRGSRETRPQRLMRKDARQHPECRHDAARRDSRSS